MAQAKDNEQSQIQEQRDKETHGPDPRSIDKFNEMMAEIYAEEDSADVEWIPLDWPEPNRQLVDLDHLRKTGERKPWVRK